MKFSPRFKMIYLAPPVGLLPVILRSRCPGLEKSSAPINIEADRMVSQEQDNSVVFTGNVDARQGELLIRTDEMTVYYIQADNKNGTKGSSQVKKLICKGNVQISQGDWLGTGKRMDYYAEDRKVILSGDAKAWQGQNMVAGKTITYYLDEGRSIVEGPATADSSGQKAGNGKPGRVKAVIQSSDTQVKLTMASRLHPRNKRSCQGIPEPPGRRPDQPAGAERHGCRPAWSERRRQDNNILFHCRFHQAGRRPYFSQP